MHPGRPTPQTRGYIPGLDGLRAVSILLVMLSHVRGTDGMPPMPGWWWHLGDTGNLGVRVFFVISGFLITLLLLREERRDGRVSLTRFYVRRAFRILPPLWVFLAAIAVADVTGVLRVPYGQIVQGVVFLMNYGIAHAGVWSLGHLWSLAVEEQFYLLWPLIFALAPRTRRTQVLVAGLVLSPILRCAVAIHLAQGGAIIADPPTGFFSAMDALATGCLLSIWRFEGKMPAWIDRLTAAPWFAGAPVLLLLVNGAPTTPLVTFAALIPLKNVLIGGIIDAASRGVLPLWQALLDAAPLRWIGRLSYSLYLWQQPFLDRSNPRLFTTLPVNLLLAGLCAVLSYYAVEQPVLAWRARVLRPVIRATPVPPRRAPPRRKSA